MTTITLESLGLDKEDIIDRLIDNLAERLLREDDTETSLVSTIEKRVKERIDQAVDQIAARHVLPNVTTYLETLCLQQTNQWGEKVGQPTTFIEYLVQRANAWMIEEVDHNGKSKADDSYNWRKNTTRMAYLIDKHLQYNITRMSEEALKGANATIIEGINKAVRISLEDVASRLAPKK